MRIKYSRRTAAAPLSQGNAPLPARAPELRITGLIDTLSVLMSPTRRAALVFRHDTRPRPHRPAPDRCAAGLRRRLLAAPLEQGGGRQRPGPDRRMAGQGPADHPRPPR